MHTLLKLRNARKVVSQLGAARPGMEVLVLSDLHTHHNVEPLAIAVDEAGASLNLMQIAGSARHGRQLSPVVAEAMQAADLVIALTGQRRPYRRAPAGDPPAWA